MVCYGRRQLGCVVPLGEALMDPLERERWEAAIVATVLVLVLVGFVLLTVWVFYR